MMLHKEEIDVLLNEFPLLKIFTDEYILTSMYGKYSNIIILHRWDGTFKVRFELPVYMDCNKLYIIYDYKLIYNELKYAGFIKYVISEIEIGINKEFKKHLVSNIDANVVLMLSNIPIYYERY